MKTLRKIAIQWFLRIQHLEMDHPDRAKFEAWLLTDVANQKAYTEVETLWTNLDSTTGVKELTTALDQHTKFSTKKLKTIASASSIIVISLIGLLDYQTWQTQPVSQLTATADIGQLKSQILADGSKVILNANTTIEVIYYRDHRSVNLKQGEAIFEIAHDENKPFIVESGKAKITVLGTRFAVNRLKNLVRVSVDYGRVRVHAQQPNETTTSDIILNNGEVAEVNQNALPMRINRQAADAFSFESGLISFKDANLAEIAETLSRYCHTPIVAVQVQDNAHVTALIKTKNIEQFIQNLPDIAPVTVKTTSGITTLKAKTATN